MANFKIIKVSANNFKHIKSSGDTLSMSDFSVVFLNETFNLIMRDGSKTETINVADTDVIVSGITYNGFTSTTLKAKLIQIGYTPYLTTLGFTNDQIDAIQNANTPNGSNHFATMADIAGVTGLTPYQELDPSRDLEIADLSRLLLPTQDGSTYGVYSLPSGVFSIGNRIEILAQFGVTFTTVLVVNSGVNLVYNGENISDYLFIPQGFKAIIICTGANSFTMTYETSEQTLSQILANGGRNYEDIGGTSRDMDVRDKTKVLVFNDQLTYYNLAPNLFKKGDSVILQNALITSYSGSTVNSITFDDTVVSLFVNGIIGTSPITIPPLYYAEITKISDTEVYNLELRPNITAETNAVPYTGATDDVDLGDYILVARNLVIGQIDKKVRFNPDLLTANRSIDFQDKDYIIAGLDDIPDVSGLIPDAPNNANAYVRSGLSWVIGYTKAAIDTLLNGKQNTLGFTPENSANKGANNGYAGLDSTGKVPSSQLPSYVDDVLEFSNLASFPTTGESGKIYVALDTNLIYRWSGTTYINVAIGSVQSVNSKTGVVTLNQDDILNGTTYKQYSLTEKNKLSGIATGATANDTDANLKNRANHTGTQLASTISDFATAVSLLITNKVDKIAGYSLTKNDLTDSLKTAYDNAVSNLTTLLATGSRLITSGEITKLSNTSGTNTGDQDLSGKVDKVSGSRLITTPEATILGNTTGINTGDQDLSGLVIKNTPITGATKTKITYDSKGLIISGADATTSDIAEGSNLYFTTTRVLATLLSGLSLSTTGAIVSTDTILIALGKLQNQISTLNTALSGYVQTTTTINSKALSSNITLNTDDIAEYGTPTNKWWTNARTIASTLTSFSSSAGTVSATDTILQAIQKIVGNIALKMDLSMSSYSLMANNTNASANAVAQVFKAIAKQTYSGTITWTGTTAPSGTTNHSYYWQQIGNLVTLKVTLLYGTAGNANTRVVVALPSDCPTPSNPNGLTANSSFQSIGSGQLANTITGNNGTSYCYLRINSTGSGYEVLVGGSALNAVLADFTIQYFTT